MDERENREAQLQAQDHLVENEEKRIVPLSPEMIATTTAEMIAMSRVIRAAKPGSDPQVEKTFHHDLASNSSGEGGVLA